MNSMPIFCSKRDSPTAGVLDLESSIAKMWGDNEVAKYQFVALVSYLMPVEIGYGRVAAAHALPARGQGEALDASDFTSIEAQLGYIIDGFHARLLAVYQYAKVKGQVENSVPARRAVAVARQVETAGPKWPDRHQPKGPVAPSGRNAPPTRSGSLALPTRGRTQQRACERTPPGEAGFLGAYSDTGTSNCLTGSRKRPH
jgi:hypothetical protein